MATPPLFIYANMNTKAIDTIEEKGSFFLIGMLPVYARPLTLSQVIEIGEISAYMREAGEIKDGRDIFKFTFDSPIDVECLQEIAVVALFRSRLKRKVFGWYVRRKMNTRTLKKCMSVVFETFDYAFFFNASISLRGVKKIVGVKATETHPGDK